MHKFMTGEIDVEVIVLVVIEMTKNHSERNTFYI